jgi:NADP-dependent 3-hydroxy acid dehydrogenase YdfG
MENTPPMESTAKHSTRPVAEPGSRTATAVVTGATSGIGREVARQLAELGWQVVAIGRDQASLDELAASTERISPRRADLLADDLDALVPERVDAVVHAAGISPSTDVEHTSDEDWEWVLALNVTAGAALTRRALPALRASRGTVVFVNSGAGTAARPRNTPYAASKHALRALANGLRVEEEGNGVRVSTVYPGPTDTPMFGGDVDRAELIRPASVARAVVMAITATEDVQLTDIHVRPRRELSW